MKCLLILCLFFSCSLSAMFFGRAQCAICIETDSIKQLMRLPKKGKVCGHRYHYDCLEKHFQAQQEREIPQTCPECRTPAQLPELCAKETRERHLKKYPGWVFRDDSKDDVFIGRTLVKFGRSQKDIDNKSRKKSKRLPIVRQKKRWSLSSFKPVIALLR